MAVNWGASDIIQGLRIAWDIYQYGFRQENAADVLYNNFRNDVFNFHELLEGLNRALHNARERYLQQRHQLEVRAYDPLSEEFDKERRLIVGNFGTTLNECQALLDRNRELRERHSNVWQNLKWHMAQQSQRAEDLRNRLTFHSAKIRLVIDRLVINLLTDQDSTLNDVLAMSEQNLEATNDVLLELRRFRSTLFEHLSGSGTLDTPNPEDEHVVGPEIARRLERYLQVDPPSDLESGIPITPGFDALFAAMLAFKKSVDATDQTPESYLLFLKTRWLLERIKICPDYQSARPGFYYKRAVNQIARVTLAKMRQPGELIKYPESILMGLPDTLFHIWPITVPQPQNIVMHRPHPLMVRANEEKVLRLELASGARTDIDVVTIFKSSEERFRIVLEQTLPSMSNARELIAQIVLTSEDKLIPRFALPTLTTPSLELALYSRGEETFYQFQSMEDLNRFQSTLTGYQISHDQREIICQFSKKVSFLDSEKAHIQLWQDPIGLSSIPDSEGEGLVATTSRSQSSSEGSHSRHDSLFTSLTRTSTISSTGAGWEADRIKLSALVIFTQISITENGRSRFAMIFIELGRHMRIDRDKCNCWKDYDKCSKIVLTRRDGADFKVRIFYSETDPQGQPDPNSFDLLQFRQPRHPNFHNLLVRKTEFLLLKFKNLEAKTVFRDELNLRFVVRDAQLKEQREFENNLLYLQDQPKRVRQSFSQHPAHS